MLLCSEFWPRDSRPGCGSHATPRASKAVVSIRRSPRCVNLFRRPPLAGKGFARVRFLPPQPRAIRAQGISSVPLRSRGPQVGRRVHAKEGVHIGCREGSQRHPPFAPTWRGERSGGRGGAKLARRRASRVARRSGATLCGAFSPASRAGFSRRTGWGPTPSVRRGGVVPPGHDASSGMPGRGPTPSPPQTTPAGPQAAPKDLGAWLCLLSGHLLAALMATRRHGAKALGILQGHKRRRKRRRRKRRRQSGPKARRKRRRRKRRRRGVPEVRGQQRRRRTTALDFRMEGHVQNL